MKLNIDARDLLLRALHTFWQAFVAAAGVAWAASGLDVSQIVDLDSAKKFAVALGIAVAGAALSAVKTTVASLLAGGRVDDTGPGSIDAPEGGRHEAA